MNEIPHSNHQREGQNSDRGHQGHRPYWTRAHRDWRIWVGVFLMLWAMVIYVMTGDLAWRPRSHPQQPLSGTFGK